MPRYVAFLGSINVGGHSVRMERLRELFAEQGHARVETFIASGNVLFETATADALQLEQELSAHLAQSLGFPVPVYLRTADEVSEAAAHQPFDGAELEAPDAALYIVFLPAPPPADAAEKLAALRTPDDEFHVRGRELYWLRRRKISESKITAAQFRKALGATGTSRNSTTVRKLAAKFPA